VKPRTFAIVTTLLLAWSASTAAGQDGPGFRPRQVTVSGGAALGAGYPIGDLTVNIPRNATGTPPPFTLLRAESDLGRAAGIEVRVAYAFARSFAIEVGGAYARPELGVSISQDPELAERAFASEKITQYVVDVSGIYPLPIAMGRRARAYAIGGGGYLRQLHEGRLLVETGATLHAGGGLQYFLARSSDDGRAFGVRGEARYVRRTGGIDFDERSRTFPLASVLAFLSF
jgi:hypothetical protein